MPLTPTYPLIAYSESTNIIEGSYSLKGIAAQTTSLNKTLTRTISSPINLTGHAYIVGKIRSSRTGSNIKIGFHDQIGATVLSGGSVTADSNAGASYVESYGCDGSTTTRWTSANTAFPHWWKYDLGTTKTVTSLGILKYYDANGCIVKDFTIHGSNDDSTYTLLYTGIAASSADKVWESFYFNNTTAYRYYKITVTSNYRSDYYVGFWEIILSETNSYHEITPNISAADTWQTIQFDISGVYDANKDAIDQIIITITNADADNTFYLDNFYAVDSTDFALGMQVSKTVGYSVIYPIANAMNVSKVVAYAVLGPYVEPADSGPMMWIF